jgi:hypothetical protein
MRPIIVTSGAPGTPVVPLDYYGPSQIALQVVVSGSTTWTVMQTLDNPSSSPTWFSHPDTNLITQTGNRQGNYAYLPRALYVSCTGAGVVTLTVIQADTRVGY